MSRSKPRVHRVPNQRRILSRKLRIEVLEPRRVLATVVVTNTGDSGIGTLRQAILDANAMVGADVIEFQIPNTDPGFVDVDAGLAGGDAAADAFVIQPLSPLPALNDATGGTSIDGQTQTAFGGNTNPFGPEIVLDGSLVPVIGFPDGLQISSDNNQVFHLGIESFPDDGIQISGSGNWVAGSFVGTDATGTVARGNGFLAGGSGAGVLIINGAQANVVGTNGDGVDDASEGNVVSANMNSGVHIQGIGTHGNIVAGNLIGTNGSGLGTLGNGDSGVTVSFGPQANRIGTDGDGLADVHERNLISGNAKDGIRLNNASHNVIAGNYIGTDVTGTLSMGNGIDGIRSLGGAAFNRIGTNGDGVADIAERNIISSNPRYGIILGNNWIVAGNFIGTDVTGTLGLGNGQDGVVVAGGSSNRIGTNGDGVADADERNIISANIRGVTIVHAGADNNVVAGNYIGTDVTGTMALGNQFGGVRIEDWGSGAPQQNRVGTNGDGLADVAEGNLVAANGFVGVSMVGAVQQNVVAGNYIGTDVTGTLAMGNDTGVLVAAGARSNRIGTDGDGVGDSSESNLISGNGRSGVEIKDAETDENVVAGNFIGTDASGAATLSNGANGVLIGAGAESNLVGTNGDGVGDAAERNVISGNANSGIQINEAHDNAVAGNYVGTDVTGTAALGNSGAAGVWIFGGHSNRIGTNGDGVGDLAEANLISGNTGFAGVFIERPEAANNVVAGNYVGTDVTGTQPLGNQGQGVEIKWGARMNRVGTNGDGVADEDERNIISANAANGVSLWSRVIGGVAEVAEHNVVAGNFIGTDVTGSLGMANGQNGVQIFAGAQSNVIGSDGDGMQDAAEANTIAYNSNSGVLIIDDGSTGNAVRKNSIHSNGGQGIALGNDGVTANDADDVDEGPNQVQNYPALAGVVAGAATQVIGGLHSQANTTYTLEFFANSAVGPSGFGEGERSLDSFSLTTDAVGNASFDVLLAAATGVGEAITATATDPDGNTSEFSQVVTAGVWPNTFIVTNTNDSGPGSLRTGLSLANVASSDFNIVFQIPTIDSGFVDTDSGMIGGDAAPDVYVITPLSQLPAVNNPLAAIHINGSTQSTFGGDTNAFGPEIVLDGRLAGINASGLFIRSDHNVVSHLNIQQFGVDGVRIAGSHHNLIHDNYIGTDATGTLARGNRQVGVRINLGAQFNAVDSNVISGNGFGHPDENDGVRLAQTNTANNVVSGNKIGTDQTGVLPIGNRGNGVFIRTGARHNQIGSNVDGVADNGEGNVIAFNGGNGVHVRNDESIGNRIRLNSIHSNARLGVELGNNDQLGVTPNDSGDRDSGPNRLRNFPVLRAASAGAQTRVVGRYNSTPDVRTYQLDFYANSTRDSSGHGEGQRYLGSVAITTNASGNSSFDVVLPAATTPGDFITATATDTAGNTSEFSGAFFSTGLGSILTGGGPDDDEILISLGSSPGTINVTVNGVDLGDFPDDEVLISGFEGNDLLLVDAAVSQPVMIFGGPGDDVLQGGSANDVLDGGEGDDTLDGGAGADVMDGGDGSNTIVSDGDDHLRPFAIEILGPVSLTPGSTAVRGQSIDFSVIFPDPSSIVAWSFGDGNSASGDAISQLYAANGTYLVTVDITDSVGSTTRITREVAITTVALQQDPVDAALSALAIGGSTNDDTILVDKSNSVEVFLDGSNLGTFDPTGRLLVFGQAGNDDIEIAGSVQLPAWLSGGAGNDRVKGGSGNDVLTGEAGDDLLLGGNGRDLMLGGVGADRIIGNTGDDLLIAGLISFVDPSFEPLAIARNKALGAVMAEWSSSRDYVTRVESLTGVGTGPRANINFFLRLDETVLDDDDADSLTGASGRDWFFLDLEKDIVTRQALDEVFGNDLATLH